MKTTITTTLRINDIDYEKIKIIASNEQRSVNSQLEFMLKQSIKKYELENGEITIANADDF